LKNAWLLLLYTYVQNINTVIITSYFIKIYHVQRILQITIDEYAKNVAIKTIFANLNKQKTGNKTREDYSLFNNYDNYY